MVIKPPEPPSFRSVWLFIITIVITIGLVVGGVGYAVYTSSHQVGASCSFWRNLATVPLTPVPPASRPSKFGVTLVVSALEAYKGEGCGTIQPHPDLVKWARFYQVKLP